MRKSEIYRTCGFRHRKSLPESKAGSPDGSPSTSLSIRTFTGISRQSVDGWCCRRLPLPEDIRKLGVEGVNRIWREAKLRGTGMKRAKTLVTAAEHSVGSKESPEVARIELKMLLHDIDVYASRVEELLSMLEAKLSEIPYIG